MTTLSAISGDRRIIRQPFDFNIYGAPNKHIGFGAGVHFYLSAAQARLELKIVFEALVRSGLQLKLNGEPQ